ncbi:hypothetical protein [Paenibacillus sp. FJAT-26967]|uniref:hypothetical protein n=1 Tax=Paenibacillus sp. FJAT-26967 TaxID=1729690 RepID=UPI00083995C5|nr:hypothetical protein [Paenibacillus sp. FJAT-26967]
MCFHISVCSTEAYQEKYLTFLLDHYSELNLPYSFPMTLTFLASPILVKEEAFLCFNDEDEVVGAFGYIFGTGENNYEDSNVVQIQTMFIKEPYRTSRLFLETMQYVMQYMAQLNRKVTEICFWTPVRDDLHTLLNKLFKQTAAQDTIYGRLEQYRASFSELYEYAMRFRHEHYFGT